VLDWNGLLRDKSQEGYVDALSHKEPKNGYLYGSEGMPMLPDRIIESKKIVVEKWLSYRRKGGWKGKMIAVDDLLKSYGSLLDDEKIIGIALAGDVNASRVPLPKEIRVQTWNEITAKLMSIHEEAVASDPNPFRLFKYRGCMVKVKKERVGNGYFKLEDLSENAYEWVDKGEDTQKAFEQLAINLGRQQDCS
jgi:hypothetical protein